MSNVQIPNLPVAIALNGTEALEAVQSGTSVQTTVDKIAQYTNTYYSGQVNSLTIGPNGPTITAGVGVPVSIAPKGSIYICTNGAIGSTLYVSQGGGAWNAVAGV